ncbi:hypothetical protein C8J56DRAFT_910161 [Mycena floridula]|nr:hypothetical protein C8J56DRAFT_910161 [Mycena floridula]
MGQATSRHRDAARQEAQPEPSTSEIPASESPNSPRTSRRRSILNLVKPRSSHDNLSSGRRSWRQSRRFSKVTPEPIQPVAESSHDASEPSDRPLASQIEKGKERAQDLPLDSAPEPDSEASSDSSSLANRLGLSATVEEEEVVISPEQFQEEPAPAPVATTIVPDPPQPAAPQNRQFPPPGTLVVVQGVVHTTDIPRPASSEPVPEESEPASAVPRPSTPAGTERVGARNRLSALLRSRPSSMAPPESPSVPAMSSDSSSDASTLGPLSTATTPSPETSPPPPSDESRTTAISSSSIDVLGTLLSVAAAATAASLLTGSTDHMQPGGLPPSPISPTNRAADTPTANLFSHSRPTSPTPTAGLGQDAAGASGRAERMRHAWGSIRERLGLRSNGTLGGNRNSEGRTGADGNTLDARERMLAEMARAFNMGLGLSGDAFGAANGSVPTEETETNPALPPVIPSLPAEGSFERFLVDLQADLRIALTQQPAATAEAETPVEEETIAPTVVQTSESESGSNGDEQQETDDEMPPLEPISTPAEPWVPSEGEEGWALPTAAAPTAPEIPADRQGGRINWWRLYRFPAIAVSRAVTDGTRPGGVSVATPTSPTSGNALPSGSTSNILPLPEIPVTVDPSRQNTVVPVIVVGLQSVNMTWNPPPPPPAFLDGPDDGLDFAENEEGVGEEMHGESNDDARGRERRWHSRAATALRSLRPGHRPTPANTPELDAAGSRTFLIYVIGGYYPPDHTIVTGEPNNLDSFEALLDLAELLGTGGKPPTASKDEINKSGLEVIKSTLLAQYERDGKISSNCTDRCLICLDDYDPEDDVRVLTCRHAFHMDCVDKWLSTGRNNCPACRSKGVSTDGVQMPEA